VEVFSLSFLDCICCGFGAVILFYTILSAQSGIGRARLTADLSAEVDKLEEQVLEGRRDLAIERNTLEKTTSQDASATFRTRQVLEKIDASRRLMSVYDETSLARRERIEKLKADVRSLETGARRLEGGSVDNGPPGQQLHAFRNVGGERRYITGIQLRGKHILILLDRSASMLHEDLVNIIVLRNSTDATKRQAAKWRRAVDTTNWLLTQMPAGAWFQIYAFNTRPEVLLPDSGGEWLDSSDPKVLARNAEALGTLIPEGGTSLINAFSLSKNLKPEPDQIVLITDGLPTQGTSAPLRKYISADGRLRLFEQAIGELPRGVPIDIVLLPMKGDNPAARAYWGLAAHTNGVMLMPSKDWP
jgi:hypothetical protein